MLLGLELALMGMGTVFIFLIVLIVFTRWMSQLVGLFEDSSVQENNNKTAGQVQHMMEQKSLNLHDKIPDETLSAIISAAIKQHRAFEHQY